PTLPCSGRGGSSDPNPSASITAPVSARHNQVRLATIGCGAVSVRAPPASGRPPTISCRPSASRKSSAPVIVLAASTSQARTEGSRIQRSCGCCPFLSSSYCYKTKFLERGMPCQHCGGGGTLPGSCPRRLPMIEPLVVRREVQVAAPPATVFAFLTDPEKIMRWMGTEATVDPHPGGIYLVNVGGKHIARGSFTEVIP